ncbi:MAG: TlpA family protein disulfide reductase [Nannocystis sp.]|nr:TlpA family protein disulfide reductase [Nannocystis sp.]
MRAPTLVLAAAFTLLGLAPAGCSSRPPHSLPSVLWEQPAPPLRAAAIDGRTIDTAALRGRVYVVEFFASYCEPCKRSLPALRRLAERDRELVVIGIGEDDQRALTEAMAATYTLPFPVVHDVGNVIASRFRLDSLPLTVVVDGDGLVRWLGDAQSGARDLKNVIKRVRRGR